MEYRTIDLGGPCGYADYGGEGPTLVLVHGLAGSHVNWMLVAPRLAERYRVLAPDLIGFGRTPLAGRTATVEANLEYLTRFVEEVAGGPSLIVGHSMGGLLTMSLAAARPDLVTAAVLVSAASPPGDECHPMPAEEEALLLAVADDIASGAPLAHSHVVSLGAEKVVQQAFAYMCARPVDPLLLDAHIEQQRVREQDLESTVGYLQAYKSLREGGDDFETFDGIVRGITAPVLVLHGLKDPVVPSGNMLRAVRLRPDWDAVWLNGVGHNVQMEAPDETIGALEPFLARHAARARAAG